MEKGVLSKALEKKAGKALVELTHPKGVLVVLAPIAFPLLIGILDDYMADKIPEPYKTKIADALTAIFGEKDYPKAIQMVTDFADSLIDIPGIDDPGEKAIFDGLARMVAGILAMITPDGKD